MVYRDLKWKLDDGYVHFLRLSLWIQYFRHSLAQRSRDGRLVYAMPDFISLKEVFVDIYLTPYRRRARLWRLKAVSFEDGRVYIQSDRTITRTPEKLSPKAAFNSHLLGRCHPDAVTTSTTLSNKERRIVPFAGQYWEVYWGELDGLGLCYSSQVDMIDRASQHMNKWASSSSFSSAFSSSAVNQLLKVFSKRHFMYRTHLYPPPRDTRAWRERMWFMFLECWADYQFGKVPSIIGGELEGQEVTAIRLFCAQTLPQLAEAWCEKPAWDQKLGEQYLSSLLRFIKYWCNRRTRETLSFELQENGDVLCCRRKFKIASRHFLVNNILPDEFVKDLYPAPPPKPKPNWPGKRGRKCKPKKIVIPRKPRRKMCYWKLPRYSEVEKDTPPPSPPRFVFRPGMGRKTEEKEGRGRGRGEQGDKGGWNRDILHPKSPMFFPCPRKAKIRRKKKDDRRGGQTQEGRKQARHRPAYRPRSRPPPPRPRNFKRLPIGLTRPQVSRWIDKRARDWYKSTLPVDILPKVPILEDNEEEEKEQDKEGVEDYLNKLLFSSSPSSLSGDEMESKSSMKMTDEALFTPLPASAKTHKHTTHKRSRPKQIRRKQPIREDDEAYENLPKYIRPVIGPRQRLIPRLKGLQRISKVLPVPPVPEDDASYAREGESREGRGQSAIYRGNVSLEEMTRRRESDEEGLTDMIGVL